MLQRQGKRKRALMMLLPLITVVVPVNTFYSPKASASYRAAFHMVMYIYDVLLVVLPRMLPQVLVLSPRFPFPPLRLSNPGSGAKPNIIQSQSSVQ